MDFIRKWIASSRRRKAIRTLMHIKFDIWAKKERDAADVEALIIVQDRLMQLWSGK